MWESRRLDYMDRAIPLMTVLTSHVTDSGPMARRKRAHVNGTTPITMLLLPVLLNGLAYKMFISINHKNSY
jgi:hypothetical protein